MISIGTAIKAATSVLVATLPFLRRLKGESDAATNPHAAQDTRVDELQDEALRRLGVESIDDGLWTTIFTETTALYVRPVHFTKPYVRQWLSDPDVIASLKKVSSARLVGAEEGNLDTESLLGSYMNMSGEHRSRAVDVVFTAVTFLTASVQAAAKDAGNAAIAQAGFVSLHERLAIISKTLDFQFQPRPGPWMGIGEFFAPLLHKSRMFNHMWGLVGRSNERDWLLKSLASKDISITLLVGTPGGGKTRLLREVLENLPSSFDDTHIWILSPTDEVTLNDFECFKGTRTLLVVDDAHDRDDMAVLMRYCARPENQCRLLLVIRPYGRDSLRQQAATISLSGPLVCEVELLRPTKADATKLAEEVLVECGGSIQFASEIANVTYGSPLATVLAAQVVSKDKIHPALLGNVEEFKKHILARFQDVITGTIASDSDSASMQAVLRVVSLVQPINPENPALVALIKAVEGIEVSDTTRLLRSLIEAGVLFRRGTSYRLAPDLLADSVIERYCISYNGSSNGYAETVFEHATHAHFSNVLINLGKLDWRIRNGETEDSQLLQGLWSKLSWQSKYSNPHVSAAASAAYYQPRMALDFARALIADGHGCDATVCELIRNAGYNYRYLEEACSLLWIAAQYDSRPLGQHPHHGIRLLKEMAQLDPSNPLEYVELVVEFAISLLPVSGVLDGAYSPFDILEGALITEGHETKSATRGSITFAPFAINPSTVIKLRERVISTLLDSIKCASPRAAFLAAQTIQQAFRTPMGMLGLRIPQIEVEKWNDEHFNTITELHDVVSNNSISAEALYQVAASVSWHAQHGVSPVKEVAVNILKLLDKDLKTRCVRALLDEWGTTTWPITTDMSSPSPHALFVDSLVTDIHTALGSPKAICDYFERLLVEIDSAVGIRAGTQNIFVGRILTSSLGITEYVVELARKKYDGGLSFYAGTALGAMVANHHENADLHVRAFLKDDSVNGLRILAEAFFRINRPITGFTSLDLEVLYKIFSSKDTKVLRAAEGVFRKIVMQEESLAIKLLCELDFAVLDQNVNGFLSCICHKETTVSCVSLDEWGVLLEKLQMISRMDGYWVRRFLKDALRNVPQLTIRSLQKRLDNFIASREANIRPISKEGNGEGLMLLTIPGCMSYIEELFNWALPNIEVASFRYYYGELVGALCGSCDQAMLDFMLVWMSGKTQQHVIVIAEVLKTAPKDIVFENEKFVHDLIDAARSIGSQSVTIISSALSSVTTSGVRGTTPGEPFEIDIRIAKHCSEVLKKLSRLDPSYELYSGLLAHANMSIESQKLEKDQMNAEDEDYMQ